MDETNPAFLSVFSNHPCPSNSGWLDFGFANILVIYSLIKNNLPEDQIFIQDSECNCRTQHLPLKQLYTQSTITRREEAGEAGQMYQFSHSYCSVCTKLYLQLQWRTPAMHGGKGRTYNAAGCNIFLKNYAYLSTLMGQFKVKHMCII